MPSYDYEAVTAQGNISTGRLEADGKSAAVEQLRRKGLMVLSIKEAKESKKSGFFRIGKKVKIGDLSLFSRQMSAMLDAGIPVTRALYTISKQTVNKTFASALNDIAQNVESGMSVTEAMKYYPRIFSDLYIGMIQAGELGGNLGETLSRLSEQLQKEKSLRDNIKSATFYPIAITAFALLVLIAMLLFLVPIFEGFFPTDTDIPGATRFIIRLSHTLRDDWLIILLVTAGLILIIRFVFKSPAGKVAFDRIRFNLPIFGDLVQKTIIARFSRTFSTLIAGGIPVIQALESSGASSGSILVSDAVKDAIDKIQEGNNISRPLEESGMFPPMVTQMINVGEETGDLPNLLNKMAEFYEDEVAAMTKGLTALLEPILLVIVGVVVGGMLIALYLPIFNVVVQI